MTHKFTHLFWLFLSFLTVNIYAQTQQTDCSDYDDVRESEHFIFEIPCQYLENHISPANLQKWLSHLDEAYEVLGDLMGNNLPNDGNKIKIVEVNNVNYWAAAHIGGCCIYWSSDNGGVYITSSLKNFENNDDWCFGILHELGHIFDKPSEPNWIYHAESTATFKPFILMDVIPHCHYDFRGFKTTLQEIYDDIYGWSLQDEGEDDRCYDKITLSLLNEF